MRVGNRKITAPFRHNKMKYSSFYKLAQLVIKTNINGKEPDVFRHPTDKNLQGYLQTLFKYCPIDQNHYDCYPGWKFTNQPNFLHKKARTLKIAYHNSKHLPLKPQLYVLVPSSDGIFRYTVSPLRGRVFWGDAHCYQDFVPLGRRKAMLPGLNFRGITNFSVGH